MSLAPGDRLGAYEILSAIGAGGMGEVYRARDTRLKRDVAIKILPDGFADDPERLARFQREAELLATLNHPSIAQIYGLEHRALILELVDGPNLAERIATGPIPLDEALPIARQIAEALEAAHERGVIHRDLKPANVKLTPDGKVKVLDFGLAKAMGPTETGHYDPSSLSQSPTITSPAMTMGGLIIGTAAYMSPEQARGKPVDKRTDIWAFGCVLFEMLSGRHAYAGEDVSDVLAAVLRSEPDWSALPVDLPPAVRRLLRRCLAKDQKQRLADMRDVGLEIVEGLSSPFETTPESTPIRKATSHSRLAWSLMAVSATLVALLAGYLLLDTPDEAFSYHTSILPQPGSAYGSANTTPASFMALSPDGRSLAYVASDGAGKSTLWIRTLDSPSATPLAGTEGAREPFWSADSRAVGFIADGKLKRVDSAGNSIQTIANEAAQTGAWSRDDVILFAPTNNSPVHRVAASGGPVSAVTTLVEGEGERMHDGPIFLPDGDHFLYVAVGSKATGPNQPRGIYVGSLADRNTRKHLLDNGSNVQYANGHLLFLRDNVLIAQRIDTRTLSLVGDPVTIAQDISTGGITGRGGAFSVSQAGVLAFQTPSNVPSLLHWFDRTGKQLSSVGGTGEYGDVSVAPDGKSAATAILDPATRTRDIWVIDLSRNVPTRFTLEPSDEVRPVWSSDGQWVAFARRREGTMDLFRKSANGRTDEKLVDRGIPVDWSSDGRHILFLRSGLNPANQMDLWVLPLDTRQARAYSATPFNEPGGAFSPDGKWMAYVSTETGEPEVYVDGFPATGQKQRVSLSGGSLVRWSRDGRELLYRDAGGMLVATEVDTSVNPLRLGQTHPLFRPPVRPLGSPIDVSPDGQRFLLNTADVDSFSAPISLVLNWPALMRKK